jgi:hypothetical protein
MQRRKFLKSTALTAAALGTGSLYSYAAAKKKPNVIVIISDDIGYGDVSCHGNPILKTPHLDRLAKGGSDFTDFHVTPVCWSFVKYRLKRLHSTARALSPF